MQRALVAANKAASVTHALQQASFVLAEAKLSADLASSARVDTEDAAPVGLLASTATSTAPQPAFAQQVCFVVAPILFP